MRGTRDVIDELEGLIGDVHGVSKSALFRIVSRYGPQDAVDAVQGSPYELMNDIRGIGFLTADRIALKLGVAKDSEQRIQAGVIHVMEELAWSGGHTRVKREHLQMRVWDLLRTSLKRVQEVIELMLGLDGAGLVTEGEWVWLTKYWGHEQLVATRIRELMDHVHEAQLPVGEWAADTLAADQVEALVKAKLAGVFVLTGAPGTGKTYTLKRLLESFPEATIELAAPTGKAARRMTEQTGQPAQTIHRLLQPQRREDGSFGFTKNAGNPLNADVVVVDESSMIDVWLMAQLLDAIRPGTRLVLVGDVYQLPPVGPGNVLKELLAAGVPSHELTIIKRQEDPRGRIVGNCHTVKNGGWPLIKGEDFQFIQASTEEDAQRMVADLAVHHGMKTAQVITALRERGMLSCKDLNYVIQQKTTGPLASSCKFNVGDKVIQTKNDYELGLVNGDIGFVTEMHERSKEMIVEFDNPKRMVDVHMYDNDLQLAYAITVHKFQGSEAEVVIIPVHESQGGMVPQRDWLYTGISRARRLCILVGTESAVKKMVGRNRREERMTGLLEMLTKPR